MCNLPAAVETNEALEKKNGVGHYVFFLINMQQRTMYMYDSYRYEQKVAIEQAFRLVQNADSTLEPN